MSLYKSIGLPRWLSGKESACSAGDARDLHLIPGLEDPLELKKWQSTPVFLPREFRGQKSLAAYSSWDCKESDMTEHTPTHMYKAIYAMVLFKSNDNSKK